MICSRIRQNSDVRHSYSAQLHDFGHTQILHFSSPDALHDSAKVGVRWDSVDFCQHLQVAVLKKNITHDFLSAKCFVHKVLTRMELKRFAELIRCCGMWIELQHFLEVNPCQAHNLNSML